MNKKRKMIVIILVLIIIIGIILYSIFKNTNKTDTTFTKKETIDISQAIGLEEIEKTKLKTEKVKNEKTSSKYIIGSNIYKLDAKVDFQGQLGEMLYIRESYNKLNIYKTEYEIDKYESISMQVEGIITAFEEKCKGYLNLELEEEGTEELSGTSEKTGAIPLGESIYYENREYYKSYIVEEKRYDINFYRNENNINCEFVYHLEN